jgi:hypothetical protein
VSGGGLRALPWHGWHPANERQAPDAADVAIEGAASKPLTSAQRDHFEASVVGVDGKRDLSNLRARLVADCLVTADSKPVGTAKELGQLDARLIGALFEKVRELNGMAGEESIEEAGKG